MSGNKITRQRGVSLVGMMVGMTISMVVILGMMTVYKTTARVTAEAGTGATTDGQRLAALFTAQNLLQEAGFGIAAPALGTDLIVVTGASMGDDKKLAGTAAAAAPTSGNAIVWAANIDGSMKCGGLYAPTTGGLVRLASVDCPGASATDSWDAIAWTPVELVKDDTAERAITIDLSAASCQPFGISGAGNLVAKLRTKNSTSLPVVATVCLSNF